MSKLQTMPDLSWTVVCSNRSNRYVWLYVFSKNGNVRWKDENNGMTGNGTWKIQGNKLVTRWHNSATTETWNVPIDPSNWTGTCTMKGLAYDLRAVARNYVEVDTGTVYTRTPEAKAKFLSGCYASIGKVQIAQLQFGGWLSGVATAYADAFEAHNQVLNDIRATEKLATDLLLGFALAFVGGGVGGTVGGIMKAAQASDFMIDGIKDLAKFAVRGPGGALFQHTGIRPVPMSPFQWRERINERVLLELAVVSKTIAIWRRAVEDDDDSFDAGFDPAEEVDGALEVNGVRLSDLPSVDKEGLQKDFEKGWLVAWIALEKVTHIPMVRELTADKLFHYGQRLGVANIQALLDKHCPITPVFEPGDSR